MSARAGTSRTTAGLNRFTSSDREPGARVISGSDHDLDVRIAKTRV
jgi:hypothetical protein